MQSPWPQTPAGGRGVSGAPDCSLPPPLSEPGLKLHEPAGSSASVWEAALDTDGLDLTVDVHVLGPDTMVGF